MKRAINKQADPHDIDEFYHYLKDCLDRIHNLCTSLHDGQCRIFKKTLLFAFLDGLSTSVIPRETGHIEKMRKLISEFGGWEGAERISLSHLCKWLSLKPEFMEEERKRHYCSILYSWSADEIRSIAQDPPFQEVQHHIKSSMIEVCTKDLRNITHAGLLSHQRH